MLVTDQIDLLLDSGGDLVVGEDLSLSTGLDAVAQGARIACLLVRGEWFANLDDGIPYFERDGVPASSALLGGKFRESKVVRAFRGELQTVTGVDSVVSISATFDGRTRNATVNWRVKTVFGDTIADSLAVGS